MCMCEAVWVGVGVGLAMFPEHFGCFFLRIL